MQRSREDVERLMSTDKVETLLLALEIIVNGDPISIGLDEVSDVCQKALNVFDEES